MGRVSVSQEESESCGQREVMAAMGSMVDLKHISPQLKKRTRGLLRAALRSPGSPAGRAVPA